VDIERFSKSIKERSLLEKELQTKLWKKNYDFGGTDDLVEAEYRAREARMASHEEEKDEIPAKQAKMDIADTNKEVHNGVIPGLEKKEDVSNYIINGNEKKEDVNDAAINGKENKENDGITNGKGEEKEKNNATMETDAPEPRAKKKIDWKGKLYLAPLTTVI